MFNRKKPIEVNTGPEPIIAKEVLAALEKEHEDDWSDSNFVMSFHQRRDDEIAATGKTELVCQCMDCCDDRYREEKRKREREEQERRHAEKMERIKREQEAIRRKENAFKEYVKNHPDIIPKYYNVIGEYDEYLNKVQWKTRPRLRLGK